jgi:hypothetical protein
MSSQVEKTEFKVKGLDRKLKQTEVDFMKIIEEQNLQRVLKLKRTRKNNILTGKSRNFHFALLRIDFSSFVFVSRSHIGTLRAWHLRVLHVGSATGEIPRRL